AVHTVMTDRLPHHPIFYYTDTPNPEIYPLSLHDALPILAMGGKDKDTVLAAECYRQAAAVQPPSPRAQAALAGWLLQPWRDPARSEEHTSELQSLRHLVCRLLLEKKKTTNTHAI